jgi:serine-type D-Ala-D-Ala endopeptidase (penicillin-binding protein 7)
MKKIKIADIKPNIITGLVILTSFFIIIFFYFDYPAVAEEGASSETSLPGANQVYNIFLDKSTVERGYTVSAFSGELKLSLTPKILAQATEVEIVDIKEPLPLPWKYDLASGIYQFEFKNKKAYDNTKPFIIQFSYLESEDHYKQVFYFDKNFGGWRPLPSVDYPDQKYIRSLIHLPFARLAIFTEPEIITVGSASWYKYKGGMYAASPDFPAGSRLRVFSNGSDKFVDVTVNDYGPDRKLHPDRVLDLDKVAFAKLADLSEGIIKINVKPLSLPLNTGLMASMGDQPVITASSAVAVRESDLKIIWSKNATTTSPLASLTKLVAIKVFLDLKPNLNDIIAYSKNDEKLNYQYCKEWESARLNLEEGETLTIENLLYSSLVGSTNNTVETLVRASGLVRKEFIDRMNIIVASWGASTTKFVEPTGLAPSNVSSSLDYAIITKNVYEHPIIVKASIAPSYSFTTINKKKAHKIKNTNELIKIKTFDLIGSKTGYLDEAGYCLMVRGKGKDDSNIIVVTMGAKTREKSFQETKELLLYGLNKIQVQ